MVDAAELKAYINRIVDDMDKAQLAAMEKAPLGYAAKIRAKIETLLETHYRETFDKWLETERIVCMPSFRLPTSIHPASNMVFMDDNDLPTGAVSMSKFLEITKAL